MAGKILTNEEALDQLEAGFEGVKARLRTTDIIQALLTFVRRSILARTFDGIDINNRGFRPYSQSWGQKRADAGLQTGHVDLRFSGTLYRAVAWNVTSPTSGFVSIRPISGGGNPGSASPRSSRPTSSD